MDDWRITLPNRLNTNIGHPTNNQLKCNHIKYNF